MEDLKEKVAIVTGARRGMGKSHALKLAKAGAKVTVSDISQEECQQVVDEIQKAGGDGLAIKCDVSNKKEVDEMIKKTVEKFGRVDILVNNAGICQFKPFLEMTEEEWDKTLNINLRGYFFCAQAVAKEMVKHKSGAIVNIASVVMGQIGKGMAGLAHYSASKGGIAALTKTLALELAPYNIRVNAIAPGAIDTPMAASTKTDPKVLEQTLAVIPLHRMGKAEEVSNTVLFLSSDASSYITGSIIVVDGGWIAG
ncbi:MAG TPA: SDR family NAD(P)-dependent oxidoreductase [Candidatus Humimicrobiaceae bacterium]|nr:SDR family NAD(P)-dependent oxidoreductase [Candidatus Humimicrobiaceae bacterium]